MNDRITIFTFIIAGLLGTPNAMAVEEPKYDVLMTAGDFEIRHYGSILIAETELDGDMDEATNKGFRLLADFIFGNNQAANSEDTSKIAMTAPVTIEPRTDIPSMISATRWRVQFVMPDEYTLDTIPKPKNSNVQLREVSSKHFAVIKYSGLNTRSKIQKKTDELMKLANERSLEILGMPQLARYDPPWTLPMFRRNEIAIEIAAP